MPKVGAASGIGRETALKFSRKGDKVVVADFNEEEGGEATFMKVDVTKFDQVEALVDKAVELYGSIDILHNNAGVGGMKHLLDYELEDYV